MSKYLDTNGLTYLWTKIKDALTGKVDKVDGKGLSTNDFTDEEKDKLADMEEYTLPTASDTVLGGIKVGAGLSITSGVLSATGGGTADAVEWANVLNKPDVALKSDLVSLYRWKGSVATVGVLPTSNNEVGDVWNVEESGMNYGWTGTAWDALGEVFEIETLTNEDIDAIIVG